jgi:purine-binding chemotaxis protein CheW
MSAIYLVGMIGTSAVALPADSVEAVVRIDHVVPAPGAPPSVRGLVAIRSRILTLIDSAVVVGEASADASFMAIVSIDGHGYGVMLDAVEDVVELGALLPVPTGLSAGWARLDPHLCDYRGRVLLVIDPVALIAASSDNLARAA